MSENKLLLLEKERSRIQIKFKKIL